MSPPLPQPLNESLAVHLKRFRCYSPEFPYSRPVEDNIRKDLVKEWQAGNIHVLVVAEHEQILGVSAYTIGLAGDMEMGYSNLLATDLNHRRRGIATSLKQAAMDDMRSRGCRAVSSHVHESNVGMHATNATWHFDAASTDEDGYVLVVIGLD